MQISKILLTGITGAVGSWLASEALKRDIKIAAIVRGGDIGRIKRVLDSTDCRKGFDKIEIIDADICDDLTCIISKKELSDISLVIHCAASVDFSENYSDNTYQVNINGTKNVLNLAEKMKVPACYISTAYIAGNRSGSVKENEIDVGQGFYNFYEQTKCEAEIYVQNWAKETGLPLYVFRPSIVTGDSKFGRIANFNGMYNMLRFFSFIGPMFGKERIRAIANGNTTKNLIPVDYVAKSIWHIMEKGQAGTYHITHPKPLTLEKLRKIYENLFGINLLIVSEEEYRSLTPTKAELLYHKSSMLYKPYLAEEPMFDRSNTDSVMEQSDIEVPAVDDKYFSLLLNYAKSAKWGKYPVEPANETYSTVYAD